MNYKSEIVLLAADLETGASTRLLCPHCGGGSTSEKTLSITRDDFGKLVWQCFRASCNERGTTNREGTLLKRTLIPVPKPKKQFTGKTIPLSPQLRDKVQSMWGISEPPYWYWTNEYGGRLAMSVRSPKYLHRGWVLRDIRGRSSVKALNYIEDNEESLSWYKINPNAPTVLVEDIPSSVRAATFINAVALLGTSIGVSRAIEIAEHATRPIILALDQDATDKSFHLLNKWKLLWGDVKILPLKKDLKDMTEEELHGTLHRFT